MPSLLADGIGIGSLPGENRDSRSTLRAISLTNTKTILSDDVALHVQNLIEFDLQKRCAPRYERDWLTNCKSQHQLALDISRETSGDGWQDHSIFKCSYLCIDIDKFKHFVDVDGMTASDELLKEMARQLQSKYVGANGYRFGGDEFVVELKDDRWLPLDLPEQITLKTL